MRHFAIQWTVAGAILWRSWWARRGGSIDRQATEGSDRVFTSRGLGGLSGRIQRLHRYVGADRWSGNPRHSSIPGNAVVDKGAAKAIVKQLHDNHVKAKDEIVLEPTLENDDRFAIRIHERYKHKGHVADELHLYKMVGPRPCMLTVNAQTEQEDEAKKVQVFGETTLLSAKLVKPKTKSGAAG